MDRCDVLIVGGGPAGSSCARALRKAGLDVVVMDKMRFPRDKVCAGWITPAVVEHLDLDIGEYRQGRVFQPITRFRTGLMGSALLETEYDHAVSYAIRRCEFDDYLLRRSGARMRLGEPLRQLTHTQDGWIVNDTLQAPMLVGAGGHFCPVAHTLGADVGHGERTVKAQEYEVEIPPSHRAAHPCTPGVVELYFCPDLKGYGWCVRKDDFLNIGLGREDEHGLAQHVEDFHKLLEASGRIIPGTTPKFKGHAYLLYRSARRTLIDSGVLLIGDAAGLAYTQSGEGILPAVDSGLLAADTILEANGDYSRAALQSYLDRLTSRLGSREARTWTDILPVPIKLLLARRSMTSHWLVKHLILDRGFLHAPTAVHP